MKSSTRYFRIINEFVGHFKNLKNLLKTLKFIDEFSSLNPIL